MKKSLSHESDLNRYIGKFCLVETEQRQYVGVLDSVTVGFNRKTGTHDIMFTVYTGVAGRPPLFDLADIDDITILDITRKVTK